MQAQDTTCLMGCLGLVRSAGAAAGSGRYAGAGAVAQASGEVDRHGAPGLVLEAVAEGDHAYFGAEGVA